MGTKTNRQAERLIASAVVLCLSSAYGLNGQEKSPQRSTAKVEEKHSGRRTSTSSLLPVPSLVLEGLNRTKAELSERVTRPANAGRVADATQVFRELVALDPGDLTARMQLGTALARAGDSKGAVEQYSAALHIAPGNPDVHYNLGVVFTELGSEQEAIEHFQAAIKSNPQLARAHFQLANLLMRRGLYTEAVPEFTTVIRMEPRNGFARLMEAMALIRLKKYSEARNKLEEGLAVLPDDTDLPTALARLLAACPDQSVRNGPRALQLMQQVLRTQQSVDVEQGQTLAMALAALGQFKEAAELQSAMIAELERAQQSDLARSLTANLALYQKSKPCLTPWPDDDPIFSPLPGKLTDSLQTSSTASTGTENR